MKKQISFAIWLDAEDGQLDMIERGIRNLVKGLNSKATINVFKKEDKLNIPKEG